MTHTVRRKNVVRRGKGAVTVAVGAPDADQQSTTETMIVREYVRKPNQQAWDFTPSVAVAGHVSAMELLGRCDDPPIDLHQCPPHRQ